MRLLITGMSGLLGVNMALLARDLYQTSGCYCQHPVAIPGVHGVCRDLLRSGAVPDLIDQTRPDIIIHTSGLTNVDACEEDPDLAARLNVDVADTVAALAGARGLKLVHISSDHLFGGSVPWHIEAEPPAPVNVYAATKSEAERQVQRSCPDALIIRTNFFGWGNPVRLSFSDWILNALRRGRELGMFTDVFFTPILINDLGEILFELLASEATGIYHIAGRDRLSKFEFAWRLANAFGIPKPRIRPTVLAEAGLRAPRPHDMSLNTAKVSTHLGRLMPTVREGLARLRDLEAAGWPAQLATALSHARV